MAGEATYRIAHPAAADALIDEADFERDERLPYWAELWSSAVALAGRLAREDLAGKRAIELGCGVGLPTVVALRRGAAVLATDHYGAALDFARYNAGVDLGDRREPETRLLDWHRPSTEGLSRSFDLAFAADVLYEARNAPALAALIPSLLALAGEALLADPRRKDAPRFLELMEERGFRSSMEDVAVATGGREVTVLLYRLGRAGAGGEDRG